MTTEEAAAMERQMLDPEEYDNAFVPKHRARIPRSREAHAKTELSTLLDSRYRDILSPKTPLYLFLQIKTRDGRKPVRLTNATAADLGLDRHHKSRYLHELEKIGAVRVERSGLAVPLVWWRHLGDDAGV